MQTCQQGSLQPTQYSRVGLSPLGLINSLPCPVWVTALVAWASARLGSGPGPALGLIDTGLTAINWIPNGGPDHILACSLTAATLPTSDSSVGSEFSQKRFTLASTVACGLPYGYCVINTISHSPLCEQFLLTT